MGKRDGFDVVSVAYDSKRDTYTLILSKYITRGDMFFVKAPDANVLDDAICVCILLSFRYEVLCKTEICLYYKSKCIKMHSQILPNTNMLDTRRRNYMTIPAYSQFQ